MVYDRRGKSARKRENLRSMRCRSADSGVSCTLNNKVLQQDVVQSSKHNDNINGLEEEHLDFEPDFVDKPDDIGWQPEQLINSDQSTVKLSCGSYKDMENDSESTISIAHRRDMLPLPPSDAEDGRESEYLPYMYSNRLLLDSSSDNMSSSSNSFNYSATDNMESSAQDLDESESILSMTQEEEDKLLDSSEDEAQEYAVEIDREAVVTCQIGNARITIPNFVNNNIYEGKSKCNNDLKRTTTSAKLSMKPKRTKKQKWDLRYSPQSPLPRVFLDDIGYDPGAAEDSSESSGSSVPQLKNLIVICNQNDKIVREEPSKADGKSISSNFKVPLPPPKRPPTRPKRTVSNSEEFGRNLQIKVSNKVPDTPVFVCTDKDDSISIIASTIGVDNTEDIPILEESLEPDISPFELNEQTMEQVQPFAGYDFTNERVKAWVEKVECPMVPENNSTQQASNLPINAQPSVSPKGNQRIPFNQVPVLLCGLCFYHYFNKGCIRSNRCTLSHSVPKDKYTMRFQKANPAEVKEAFQFTLNHEKLFKEIYPCFIKAFGTLKLQTELMASIKHFLNSNSVDVTEALDLVIKSLENSGLSFLDTVERISFNIGFMEHPKLADILLELISRKSNIAENWEVIKRIAKARGHVAPQIVQRILLRVTNDYPINKELCLDVYNVVLKNNMTDLTQISEDVLAPIRTMTGFGDQHGGTEQPFSSSSWFAPQAVANPRELLAAHIEGNLVKERERFEREVEGGTLRTTVHTIPSNPVADNFIRGVHDFTVRNIPTAYNTLPHVMDADERYFTPSQRKDSSLGDGASTSSLFNAAFAPAFSTSRSTGSSGGGGRGSCSSPSGSVPFEVTEYVPQTVRRNESPTQQEHIPVFEPPPDLMETPAPEEPTLTPVRPIFGRPNYREDFNFEKSLHNLLPNLEENVNIDENDILVTNNILKNQNGPEFYRLLNYYKGPATIGSFITMTIAHLKSFNCGLYDTINGLLTSLARVKPDYAKDVYVKAVFEVVVMNLLFILERRGLWGEARRLLEWFCDWDSLVSSHIFSQRRVTHMGRYIFLAKIFAKARNFHFTYEILQCPDLHLLEHFDNWPFFYNVQADAACRNAVLTDFFKQGFHHNIVDVSDMYRRLYKYGVVIYGYDATAHFNPMLISIINEQQTSLLKYFYPHIDVYYKVMHKDVLRAYTILMAEYLTQDQLMRLYEMCCERQIYTRFGGWEENITVRNNMLDVELQMILNYYFNKVSQTDNVPCGNINIHIKLMERQVAYPKILQKCVRSMKEINEKIKTILRESLGISIVDTVNSKNDIIEINVEQIEAWRNRRWLQRFYSKT